MEAEYMALSDASRELVWLRNLYADVMGKVITTPTIVYEDNEACIHITKNPAISDKSKHIQVRYHIVRSHYENGELTLMHVGTDKQEADIFTKVLAPPKFSVACAMLGVKA